jgi:FkbM family methyltransferase
VNFLETSLPLRRLFILPGCIVSAYLRNFQWELARWRLVRFAVRSIRKYGYLVGSATVTTNYGFKMALDLRDWVDQHIYATGNYEDYTGKTILNLIGPGDHCADIGANIGFFTLLMARRVGRTGKVFAFEPASRTRARLRRNLELNALNNVEVRDEAVADANGEAMFYCGITEHSGIASLRANVDSDSSQRVRTCQFESCVPEGLRFRLIKMDIEGAEHLAVKGMHGMLDRDGPDLVVEVSDDFLREMGSSAAGLTNMLLAIGYRMFLIDWDGLVPVATWSAQLPQQFNALFSRRSTLPATLHVKEQNSN